MIFGNRTTNITIPVKILRRKKEIREIEIPPPSKEVEELTSPIHQGKCMDCNMLVSRIHEISLLLQKSETEKQELFVSLTENHEKVVNKLNDLYIENSELMEELIKTKQIETEKEAIKVEIEKKEAQVEILEIQVQAQAQAQLEKEKKNKLPRVAMLSTNQKK